MNRENWLHFSEMDPLCVLRLVLRNFWLVILAGFIGFFSLSAFQTADVSRSYTSSATFVVTPVNTNYYRNLNYAIAVADTYAPVLESRIMYQLIDEHLEEDCSGTINATQLGKTNLISVTVNADNPRDALILMQAITEVHGELAPYVSATAVLDLLNTPSLSTATSSLFGGRNAALYAAVGCSGLMLVILFLISMVSGTIQTPGSAAQRLDARILGSIPHEKQLSMWLLGPRRSRKKLHVTSPNVSFSFAESIHRIGAKFEQEKLKGRSVFLLTSVSESEGKSTVAANVALSLAMKRFRVLFLDLDLRRPVQATNLKLPVEPEQELGALLTAQADPRDILGSVQSEPITGLHALLSTRTYTNTVDLISSSTLAQTISLARQYYDYIIIDLPPVGYFSESEAMLTLADASALVVRQDVVPFPVINDIIDALREGKAAFLGCILNDMYTLRAAGSGYGYGYGSKGYEKYGYGYSDSNDPEAK